MMAWEQITPGVRGSGGWWPGWEQQWRCLTGLGRGGVWVPAGGPAEQTAENKPAETPSSDHASPVSSQTRRKLKTQDWLQTVSCFLLQRKGQIWLLHCNPAAETPHVRNMYPHFNIHMHCSYTDTDTPTLHKMHEFNQARSPSLSSVTQKACV